MGTACPHHPDGGAGHAAPGEGVKMPSALLAHPGLEVPGRKQQANLNRRHLGGTPDQVTQEPLQVCENSQLS